MVYKFKDIYDESMYKKANIMIVLGGYDIFNRIAINKCRDIAIPKKQSEVNTEFLNNLIMELPTTENVNMDTSINTLDFSNFMSMNSSYPMEGRWFCSVGYDSLSKKELEQFKEYMKSSQKTGVLVVTIRDFKDYRDFLRNRLIQNSQVVNMIQLSFPGKDVLTEIITKEFGKNNITLTEQAVQLFIMRLSTEYNEYTKIIDEICYKCSGNTVGYDEMELLLKGIDYYMLDDFLEQITKNIKSNKLRANKKIYKMYISLINNLTAKTFVDKLRYKIDLMIELRLMINDGTIPILVRYGVKSIQESLPELVKDEDNAKIEKRKLSEKDKIKVMNPFTFKKYAGLASKTSLKDWLYMKMILSGNSCMNSYKDEVDYNHILLTLIHRTTFSPHRLMNDIGVVNVIDGELFGLNTVMYNDNVKLTEEAIISSIERNQECIRSRELEKYKRGLEIEKNVLKCNGGSKKEKSNTGDTVGEANRIQELLREQNLI